MMITRHWADWRWIDNVDFNVWYPTLRIWRRDEEGSYRDVAARIAADITGEPQSAREARPVMDMAGALP